MTEYAYDFENNCLKTRGGKYYTVSGLEALKIWIYKVLLTPRARYAAYSAEFGHTLTGALGMADRQAFMAEVKERIKKALESPYITDVSGFEFEFDGTHATVSFTVFTVYGDIEEETEI